MVAINKAKDRLMNQLKIGREGWFEEGEQAGIIKERQEVALRMLEDGMSVTAVCRITKLSRSVVNRLVREGGELENAKKRGRAKKRA